MSSKQPKIGILTFPIRDAGNIPLSNIIDIFYSISNNIYLITGNAGYNFFNDDKRICTYGVKHKERTNGVARILGYIYTQFKASYYLIKVGKNVDIWVFFIGGDTLVIPMLTAKLLRKKVALVFAGSSILTGKAKNDSLNKPLEYLSSINCLFSDIIIVYSSSLITEWNLGKYIDKIRIAHKHFLDFNLFQMKNDCHERNNLIGYVGRLSEEKGALNFVKAIPEVLNNKTHLNFLIIGDGKLCDTIVEYLNKNNLNDKVNIVGWISHDKLPDYLNLLNLVVLPSYTEGLPNLMLEAMACGTLVLATSVGAIPCIIKDGETGFIMENNSPACIAENIIRALEHSNLEIIVGNARALVEREFTYEVAVANYREIFGINDQK